MRRDNGAFKRVVVIDLDDTLANSIPFWCDYLYTKLRLAKRGYLTTNPNLFTLKGLCPHSEYQKLKFGYRTCGIKSQIQPIASAGQLTEHLSKKYFIVIMSKRPVDTCPGLYQLTIAWLKEHVFYDAFVFGREKHLKVLKFFPDIAFFIEDRATTCNKLARLGYRGYLLNNEYNLNRVVHPDVCRVHNLSEIIESEAV